MTPQVRLTRGNTYLDLTAAPYSVGMDFTPPAVNPAYNIAAGGSANRLGGGKLISDRYNNRQFSFNVRILSTSSGGAHAAARAISAFVKASSQSPLYLEYRENTSIPVPLWGQFGAPLRYEVVTADVGSPDANYTETGARGWFAPVTLEVKPFAVGNRQKLANASGGVFEDNYGMSDGTPRGVAMFRATTNKMTNPVFSHSTYTNGWTTGSSLVVSKNTDPLYCLPGVMQSVRITSRAATNNTFTMSINAGNTNPHALSAYVIMPDGGAPTTNDFELYYNTALGAGVTINYLGGILWVMSKSAVTGINAATNTGVVVKNGRSIILLGMQLEEQTYYTNLCYGDLLGCAWTGTAHASTSTRTAPNLAVTRDESICSIAEGAVSLVWRVNLDTAATTADQILFGLYATDYATSGLVARLESSDQKIYLTDGTNTISTAAQAFSAKTVQYLTFTWGPGGLNIYLNSANAATGATYTPATAASQALMAIGGANSANTADGVLMGFDVYGVELSSTQAAAIYAAQAATVAASVRVSAIPWLWTKDGDGVVDNCDDSTHDNWAVLSGVDGSADARTIINIQSTNASSEGWYLSMFKHGYFINPSKFYDEASGTVSATCSGGEFKRTLMGVTDINTSFMALTLREIKGISGKEFIVFARMADAGDNFTIKPYVGIGGAYYGDATTYDISTTFGLLKCAPMLFPDVSYPASIGLSVSTGSGIGMLITRTSGADANLDLDFATVISRPMIYFSGGVLATDGMVIDGTTFNDYEVSTNNMYAKDVSRRGDVLEASPNAYNILKKLTGSSAAMDIADTFTYSVNIEPRYGLL